MKDNVRKKVLFPLTSTFLVLVSVFLLSGYEILKSNILSGLDQKQSSVFRLLDQQQAVRAQVLAAVIDVISQDQELRDAIRVGDPEAAGHIAGPFFSFVSQGHGISLLSFFDTNGNKILGFYDNGEGHPLESHYTLFRAKRFVKSVHGCEIGPGGTLLFKVVVPWYDKEELIGYIEMGGRFREILEQVRDISQASFLVTLDREIFKNTFAAGQGRDEAESPGRFPLENVSDLNALTLFPLIFTSGESPRALVQKNIQIQGKSYRVSLTPFTDAGKRRIGTLVTLLDYTDDAFSFQRYFLIIVGGGTLLCLIFFLFAFYNLGELDQKLVRAQDQLLLEIENVNSSNLRLESEIFERRRAEEKLRALNENLERRVLDRTRNLESLNMEIENNRMELANAYNDLKAKQATILHQDKMASIGVLAAGVAHDINNPLGFVFNNLEALEKYARRIRDYQGIQSEYLNALAEKDVLEHLCALRAETKLDFIQDDMAILISESLEGIERIRNIVNNLRLFSRIDDSEFKSVNIEECLESTINITRNEMRHKVKVVRDYGQIPVTKCYPQQLNQVFMNLLINASQAIEKEGTITIRTWEEERSVCVSVADTGCGMPVYCLDKIFDPFFTTKEVGQGTGLGLSIAYDIIKKHCGDLTVESREGEGAVFTIRLPLVS